MNKTNQIKKDEREKDLYIIVEKNLTAIKDMSRMTDKSEHKLEIQDMIQPKVLFENHDKDIAKYMLATLYKPNKNKLRYLMVATKV